MLACQVWVKSSTLNARVDVDKDINDMTHISNTLRFMMKMWCQIHLCGFSYSNLMIKFNVGSSESINIMMMFYLFSVFGTTRNIAFCQGKNPWEKDRIPEKRYVCEGICQGRKHLQNSSSQTFCEGLHPWEKNKGLNPWEMS